MEATNGQTEILMEPSENEDEITEQVKLKKKGIRSKAKSHSMEMENGNSTDTNGHDFEEEIKEANNGTPIIENCTENGKEVKSDIIVEEVRENNLLHLNGGNGDVSSEESQLLEDSMAKETSYCNQENTDIIELEENGKANCSVDSNGTELTETECSANSILVDETSYSTETEILHDNSINVNSLLEVNGSSASVVNGHDAVEKPAPEVAEVNTNSGSDEETYYETIELAKQAQESSPDTATTVQMDNFITNKISNFWGKWHNSSSVSDPQQEPEISSSKTKNEFSAVRQNDGPPIVHPYLSQVTGRRGIRNRMNLGSPNANTTEKTPTNKGSSLSDSFRVKTDPPRLPQADVGEPVLRKYKGKRCLNVNDDYEEGEEAFAATSSKRLKLDDKSSGSGFLGTMIWSPFKKRCVDNSVKTSESQSKLSRFLSPFWFWKKSTADHNRK
ncbi:hypothetical protein RUM43_013229 [Polyplax serrata]|uniref:Uncharacterized protein n=1 Tax=Polyplax serrata TaxID=468196 RepID=A0AAN8NK45_POLSC